VNGLVKVKARSLILGQMRKDFLYGRSKMSEKGEARKQRQRDKRKLFNKELTELLKLAQSVQHQLAEDLINTHSEAAISTARALNKVTAELEQALLRAKKRRRIIKVVK
jgi:hypothetical protein